jgi:hypothetical protein
MRRYGYLPPDRPFISFRLALLIAFAIGICVISFMPRGLPHWIYFLTGCLLSYGVLSTVDVVNRRVRRKK